jgi:hypothetical protein
MPAHVVSKPDTLQAVCFIVSLFNKPDTWHAACLISSLQPGQEVAAAFFETRRYAAYKGATTEFSKWVQQMHVAQA